MLELANCCKNWYFFMVTYCTHTVAIYAFRNKFVKC